MICSFHIDIQCREQTVVDNENYDNKGGVHFYVNQKFLYSGISLVAKMALLTPSAFEARF